MRKRAFSLKIRGGLLQQIPMALFKETINSDHQFHAQCQRKLNFCISCKNLLFCSYSRRNRTEKITVYFFFLIFFFQSVDHYLPTYIFGQPSKKYLITSKKNQPPFEHTQTHRQTHTNKHTRRNRHTN